MSIAGKAKRVERNTILVPFESYMFLKGKESAKTYSEKAIERITINFNRFSVNGFYRLMDGDMGYCKDNKWTYWSVDDMKKILDDAGLPWKNGGKIECIDL